MLDIYTKDKPVPTDYHFTVIHGDEEIFYKSDLSTNPVTKTTELDFLVPDDVSGSITIRFENLGGGIFSNLDFPAIVNAIQPETNECKFGFILMKKYSGDLACVYLQSSEKRGWGTILNWFS